MALQVIDEDKNNSIQESFFSLKKKKIRKKNVGKLIENEPKN